LKKDQGWTEDGARTEGFLNMRLLSLIEEKKTEEKGKEDAKNNRGKKVER
jgi:hypothetical protein